MSSRGRLLCRGGRRIDICSALPDVTGPGWSCALCSIPPGTRGSLTPGWAQIHGGAIASDQGRADIIAMGRRTELDAIHSRLDRIWRWLYWGLALLAVSAIANVVLMVRR